MPELSFALAIASFVAGLFMFFAPCTLPLVPAYLAFISGVKQGDVFRRRQRLQIVVNGGLFVLGFTVVFVGLGVLAGWLGGQLGQLQSVLARLGGILIILFGLIMIGVISFGFLQRTYAISMPKFFEPGSASNSLLIGATFALGWTPCVGPILASILVIASTTSTAASGALLLFVFALGMGLPFILLAILYSRSQTFVTRYQVMAAGITKIGGLFLVVIGLLMLTDTFGLMVEQGYRLFYWLELEAIFDYL